MKTILVFLSVFFVISIYSQNQTSLQVIESKPFHDSVEAPDVVAMQTNETGDTGVIRFNTRQMLFDVFNASLERISNAIIDIERKEEFRASLYFENQIKVITLYAPSSKERVVYCYTFNINSKSYTKKQLFQKTLESNTALFSGANKRQTNFAQSPNGKYLAMTTDNIKKKSNSYAIHLFDANTLEVVFEQSYQENIEKYFELNDLAVDNDANVFVLGKLFMEGRKNKIDKKANYEFVLNKVNTSKIDVQSIALDQEQIKSLTISFKNHKLHLLGFYSERNVNKIKGGCDFQVNPNTLVVENKQLSQLPIAVFEDIFGEDNAEDKKDKELSNYFVDYTIEDANGNTYLLAEEFFVTSTYISNGQFGGYTTTTPHYNNILILKLNASGTLEWGRSVFKKANTPSYNAFLKENQLHVILNSGKNLKDKEDGRVKVSKGIFESSALYDFAYSENGEVTYTKIQDNKGANFYQPAYGAYKNDQFIMINTRGSEKSLMILK